MTNLLSTFYYAFNAVVPILLLILTGYFARQKGFLTKEFLKAGNRFNFRFALCALMFVNIYSLDSIEDIPLNMAAFCVFMLILLTILGFWVANLATKKNGRKGVLIQSAFRSNYAVIGLPLAGALAGQLGSSLCSAMQAPCIIYFNFMAVVCMSIYSNSAEPFNFRKVIRKIASNPIIQGLLAGVVVLVIRQYIPVKEDGTLVFSISGSLPWLYTSMNYLGRMATPMALIVLGGQFSFADVKDMKTELITGILIRLILAPIIGLTMAFVAANFGLISITPASIAVLIALFGSPLAVSSVVMASEMNADDILASQIVVWTSLLSMGTLFIQVVIFRFLGML